MLADGGGPSPTQRLDLPGALGRMMPGGLPSFDVKRLAVLHDGKQQRYQLTRHCAHSFGPEPAIAGEERFVIGAIEPAAETPAAGEQEELATEHWASALRLFLAAVARATGALDEIHAGEFEDLSRVLEVIWGTQIGRANVCTPFPV